MAEQKIVQIRKKGGLDRIAIKKNGQKIQPMLFKSKTKSQKEEGELQGQYKGKTILDTRHFLAPMWDDMTNQWSWGGTHQDLSRLIKAMKLRYPKGNKMEGQIISNQENDADRLTNRNDEVFTHPDFYGKYFMESGRVGLDIGGGNPKQEFMFLCYKGNSQTEDKSSDKLINSFIAAGTRYEIVSPNKETKMKKDSSDKEFQARMLLKAMDGDDPKMRAIATIMSIPGYSPRTEPDGLYLLLEELAAKNTEASKKFGGRTYQDRFIELASLPDGDLKVVKEVIDAKSFGILRARTGHYLFNGEVLDHIDNDIQLISFFKDGKNQDRYLELLDLLKNAEDLKKKK